MPVFTVSALKDIVREIFAGLGASPEEVGRLQQHLVGNNLIGYDSHGVRIIPDYVELIRRGEIVFGAALSVVREGACHTVLDGHWGLGQLLGWKAAQMAAERASKVGVAVVTLRNCSHLGRLGEYAERIAQQRLVGFLTVNGQGGAQLVAPWGGLERRLSVNPFAYGIPAREGAIIVDISPTVVAGGKVTIKALAGAKMPEGWVVDAEGRPTTDPNALAGPPPGSLVPLGGHKGFALGLVMDVLAGALSGGGCSRADAPRWGNATFFLALDPEAFVGREAFEAEVRDLLAYVRSSRVAPGFERILIPGEPERAEAARRSAQGIVLNDETWRRICAAAEAVRRGVEG
jgi:hydroxycarboxylate dehydrogenase B